MSTPERKPSGQTGAAVRMRRYRDRRRSGARCFHGDVPGDVVDILIEKGWLDANEATDPQRLGEVVANLTDCFVRGTLVVNT